MCVNITISLFPSLVAKKHFNNCEIPVPRTTTNVDFFKAQTTAARRSSPFGSGCIGVPCCCVCATTLFDFNVLFLFFTSKLRISCGKCKWRVLNIISDVSPLYNQLFATLALTPTFEPTVCGIQLKGKSDWDNCIVSKHQTVTFFTIYIHGLQCYLLKPNFMCVHIYTYTHWLLLFFVFIPCQRVYWF